MTHINKFSEETESLFFFSKTNNLVFNLIYKSKEEPSKYEPFLPVDDKNYQDFRIINGEEYPSPKGRKWGVKQEDIERLIKERRLVYEKGKWYLITYMEPLKDAWIDYQGYSRTWNFPTENSEILLKRVIESTSNKGDSIMDFFLGSGTTISVAHKLRRKWIGIEMGEHFYTVILPRMKKVLAYDKSGVSRDIVV
jgi:adenine specific DNA methylase Mod